LDGKCICNFGYWKPETLDRVVIEEATDIAAKITPTRFFTMDIALRTNGEWIVMELGDGGVSGLPDGADPRELYRPLEAL
jgi:hypothetical protein